VSPQRGDLGVALRYPPDGWERAEFLKAADSVETFFYPRLDIDQQSDFEPAEVQYERDGKKDVTWWKPVENELADSG
jgi:hypothetical protein